MGGGQMGAAVHVAKKLAYWRDVHGEDFVRAVIHRFEHDRVLLDKAYKAECEARGIK